MKNYFTFFALFTFSFLNAQISTDGLLAYYPFNGDILDYGPSNFTATATGSTFTEDQSGNPNSALSLDGISDYIDLSAFGQTYRENLGEISIFFKVRFEKMTDEQTILSLGGNGENLQSNVFEIEYENDQFQVESETGNNAINHELQVDSTDILLDGEWHDILITIKDNDLTYCRDGEPIYSGAYTPAETLTNRLFLGCYGGSLNTSCCFFGGHIDELQFYDRLIDKNEISSDSREAAFLNSIEYFPNPTTKEVTIYMNEFHDNLSLAIYDAKGSLVSKKAIQNQKEFTIEMPSKPGHYLVNIQATHNKQALIKIIVN